MVKGLRLLTIAILCCSANTVYSLESVKHVSVAVLPFQINSLDDISYLKTEIPEVIKKQLKEDGATVLDIETVADRPDLSEKEKIESAEEIRNLGIKNGADYVIWGSLTRIGQKFSVDAKMIKSLGSKPPDVFFVEGENIENLLGTVKELTFKIGIKLFKREKVAEILVEGNKRIDEDAIKRVISTEPGDIYVAQKLSQDLKAVYSMGYFDDIRIEAKKGPAGKIIIFKVKEKATIREIKIKGNKAIDVEDINKAINISSGSILNIYKIQSNLKQIEDLYKDKNYHQVKVTYNIHQLEHNQADLEFVIEEGEKILIKKIILEGNRDYSARKLKKMMKTSEKGFLSWLTSSGDLKMENLNQDVARLYAFYNNNGYIQAKVGEPNIEYKDNWIYITIKIDEGPRFKVGKVNVAGDLIASEKKLLEKLKITKETFCNREIIHDDVLVLTDFYSDEGYAYPNIVPRMDQDSDKLVVNITYEIDKGKQVYFEKIIIGGNTRTRDKVIRRELKVYEGELYNGQLLKRSVRNLYRIEFFEDVKVNTSKGSSDDKMILKLDVTEKHTGAFTFGGGYSSYENVFAMFSIAERNLLGRGQTLQFKGQLGGRTTKYSLSFTEPWLFDMPLAAGLDLYDWETDYDDYYKNSLGGGIRFSYPVFDYTRAYLGYNYDTTEIESINTYYASDSIMDMLGATITTSSISTSLGYDSRDRTFNPTEGSEHRITVQYAGLGGEVGFTKYTAETGWYVPLFKSTVGFVHGKTGLVHRNSGKILPDYERFFLGGINSLRGFDWEDISPKEVNKYGYETEVGGNKFVQFNFEYLVPLIKEAGIIGLIFYDTGDVYDEGENVDLGDLRKSVGYGVRWYSPMGPIRIEYGYILNPEEGEKTGGRWEFTMGEAF